MSSEGESDKEVVQQEVYRVLAKNCESEKGVRVDSNELLVMNDDFTKAWDFKPASKTDFKAKTIYGRVMGDDIVDHYILHMSGKC